MVGIYKITTPSGRVYIGQSRDTWKRFRHYRRADCKLQVGIYASVMKYGWDSHLFDVIHELPEDVDQTVLDVYEILYIGAFRDCGVSLLNIKEGGSRGKNSPVTRLKISQAIKGRVAPNKGKLVNDRTKKFMRDSQKIRRQREAGKGIKPKPSSAPPWHKGTKLKKPFNQKSVVNWKTGDVFSCIKVAAKSAGISPSYLSGMLRGRFPNKSNFMYHQSVTKKPN